MNLIGLLDRSATGGIFINGRPIGKLREAEKEALRNGMLPMYFAGKQPGDRAGRRTDGQPGQQDFRGGGGAFTLIAGIALFGIALIAVPAESKASGKVYGNPIDKA